MKKIEKKKLIGLLSTTACACLATACVVCAPMQAYEVNAETVSEISLDFSDGTHGAEFSGVAGMWYGWKTENGKLIPENTFTESAQLAYMTKTIALNETKYIAFDFYTAEQNFDIMLYPSACVPNDMWTSTAIGLHSWWYNGTTMPCLTLSKNLDRNGWLGDYTGASYLDGNAHRVEILSNGTNLSFYFDSVQVFADGTWAIPADEINLAFRGAKGSYIDNLYIGKEKPETPKLTETVLEFDKLADGNYFNTYGGSAGWSVSNGAYKANAGWASVNTVEPLELTKDWSVKFDMYLPDDATNQQFNVGFHADLTTAGTADTGRTYSFGPTVWLSSNFGRNGWLSEVVADYYTASVHSVEIQIVKKAMTLFVDGEKVYFLSNGAPYQAVAMDDTVYMLLQSTDTNAYIDNLEIKEKIAKYVVTVKDIDGNELAKERAEGAYVLPERAETDKGAFIGYNVNGELYSAGKEINVTADTEIVAVFAKLSMDEEASIRLDDPSGLRFTTRVENKAYTYLQSVSTVALGTLITKEDYFTNGDYSGLTTEFAETKLNILSKVGKVDGENYVFNGVIVGVKSSHYDWDFLSRGYMTVTYADGTSATFYTNTTVRSIAFVANEAYLDRNAEYDETVYKYLTADGDYSRYTEDELKLLDSFKKQA